MKAAQFLLKQGLLVSSLCILPFCGIANSIGKMTTHYRPFNKTQIAYLYVSPNGNDNNDGSREKPLATFSMAIRMAREWRRLHNPSIKNGIHIEIEPGVYQLYEPLFIRPEDAGTRESPTVIESLNNQSVTLSGGVLVSGWHKLTSDIDGLPKEAVGKVYVADAPKVGGQLLNFRQLWIDGKKAIRARDQNGDRMNRILSWNSAAQTCWIPKPTTADLSKVEGMEMLIHQWWAIANLRIKSYKVEGDSAELSFYQPESRIESEHPWPAPWISKKTGNSAFYLTNAIQFLDQPGEWYLDMKTERIYYWPRSGEDLRTAKVIAPSLQTLVKVKGTIDEPVGYFYFKGISFNYATWMRPSEKGSVPLQAGMYLLDAYKLKIPGTREKKSLENQAWIGRPPAAVEVSYAHHIKFEDCKFEHLASTGLDFRKGTHDDEVVGNLFKDIGGTGIQVGVYSDEAFETHLPYHPSDEREICTNEFIHDNLVTNVANEDWGCVGISAGYVKGIKIEHNEVCDVSYSGICVGWGWTKMKNAMSNNRIFANKVTHYAKWMYDVGGLYTLSAQPGTAIENNYIDSIYKAPYPHDPEHWFYFYLDEGSSFITIRNNWCPALKVMKNSNGPGNVWVNNGPQVSSAIKNAAGIETPYRFLLKERVVDTHWKINHL